MNAKKLGKDFQTPPHIAEYMIGLLPGYVKTVLEPFPGEGIVSNMLNEKGFKVTAPADYFFIDQTMVYDAIVTNPPFSLDYVITDNAPADLKLGKGMRFGYETIRMNMKMTNVIIALMPWFTLTDSDVRFREIKSYGLKSITSLPRETFSYSRIQTCVLEMVRGYNLETKLHLYDLLPGAGSGFAKKAVKRINHT